MIERETCQVEVEGGGGCKDRDMQKGGVAKKKKKDRKDRHCCHVTVS